MVKLKDAKPKHTKLINVKVTKNQAEKMQSNADKYCEGNLSAWLRYSSIKHKPRKSELVE